MCRANATGLGEAFAGRLLRGGDPPDAIAAMSDELALGALRAAASAGFDVPGAVAITGWDDTDAAAPAGLSTVRQSLRDQGETCARIALGLPGLGLPGLGLPGLGLAGPGHDPPGWEVVERASTRPAVTG